MDLRNSKKRLQFPTEQTEPTLSSSNGSKTDENCIGAGNLSLEFHFEEIRNKIKPLFSLLGKSPITSLEKALVLSEDITINSKVIRDSEKLMDELSEMIEKKHTDTRTLWEEVNALWLELEQKDEPQLEFTNAHFRIYDTLKTLKTEYMKRKQQKSLRIAQFIGYLRAELTEIWNQCLISEEEKLEFAPFHESIFTEELLEVHKEELAKWKIYQEKNQEVLQKANKRKEMWTKLREIEAKEEDPSRFVNRGGTLLKDQTQHANIMKNLPKLEAELKKLAAQFEREHGRKVTILGQDIHSMIDHEWELYNNEKSLKKQATKAKVRQSIAPPRMGLAPIASTGNNRLKRPLPTPTTPTTKRKCFTTLSNSHLDRI